MSSDGSVQDSALDLATVTPASTHVPTQSATQNSHRVHFPTVPPTPLGLEDVQPRALPTGNISIDDLLGGGIYTRRITEFCGASATGKTTLCLSVALAAQKTDTRPVFYINSEPSIIMRRLESLSPQFPEASLDKVLALGKPVSTPEAFISLIESSELEKIFIDGVSVLVVDTLPRLEYPQVLSILNRLRDYATAHDTAVVLTNGVVGTPSDKVYVDGVSWSQERPFLTGTPANTEWVDMPKLGWTLTRLVDTRVLVSRDNNGSRKLSLLYSGDTKPASLAFRVEASGIVATSAPT